uniref:Uncharacterized protein n=1 Tax=Vibrio parahaemolyticus TaxID=670 RepID=A0A0C5GX50_VIBPH|nr:hypothetical protein pVPH1_0086 [Vibrio parahaemolyticus]
MINADCLWRPAISHKAAERLKSLYYSTSRKM